MVDSCEASEKRATGDRHRSQQYVAKSANLNDPRRFAIKRLLETEHSNVDDKLATLKTAHHVDKERFQSAFRRFMGTSKS